MTIAPPGASKTIDPAIKSCAVIGAGWAGLSAAYQLASAGKLVTLYETSPHAGGRARQAQINLADKKLQLDNGQHMLIGGYSKTLALISVLRDAPSCVSSGSSARSVDAPVLQRVPLQFQSAHIDLRRKGPGQLGLLVGILTATGLSMGARLGIIAMSVRLRAAGWQTRPAESVEQLLNRMGQGTAVTEKFWEPLCIAALNTPIAKAAAQTFANVLHDSLFLSADSSDFLLPRTDLGRLLPLPMLDTLTRLGVKVRLATPARHLSLANDGQWLVDDRENQSHFDAVIVATPPRQAAELLRATAPATAAELAGFEYESIQTVYLAWAESDAPSLPAIRMLQQDDDRGFPGQWLFARESQQGLVLGAVVVSAPQPTRTLANDELAKRVCEQLTSQLGLPAPLDAKTVHEKRATFSCTPARPVADHAQVNGHSLPANLALAGDFCWQRYPATLESAVRSGEAAANAILQASR